MEFNEILQNLRKKNGLTQEQLSQKLNISRTAVSKWERGKGFPNIEALKNISELFNVPIDDLLSGKELLCAAERDNKTRIRKIHSLIFGIFDLLAIIFIFLPLYGQKTGNYIRAVNLLHYTSVSYIKVGYFVVLIALCIFGIIEIIIHFFNNKKIHNTSRIFSLILHSLAILLFIATREPYLTFFLFLLLLSKIALLLKKSYHK